MSRKRIPERKISLILLMILTAGCDDRATQIAREAASRQAQQNTAMAELNKEVAGGTRELVAADAQARKEIVGVHHELEAERSRLDTGWDSLERERQHIAADRRTESMLVPAVELVGGLAVVIIVLGFCWYALVAAHRGDDADAHLSEILVGEILSDDSPALVPGLPLRGLLGRSQSAERPQ